jgi:hypothetical protein
MCFNGVKEVTPDKLLVFAMLVFALLLVGIGLTILEFKEIAKKIYRMNAEILTDLV